MKLTLSFRKSVAVAITMTVAVAGCRATCPQCNRSTGWHLPGHGAHHHHADRRQSASPDHTPYEDQLILPAPEPAHSSSLIEPRKAPPELPPFEDESPVPSAGLTPIRRMSAPARQTPRRIQPISLEVTSIETMPGSHLTDVGSGILQVGCFSSGGCSTCTTCAPSCDPCGISSCDPCCEPLSAKFSRHYYAARDKAARIKCKTHGLLSEFNPLNCSSCNSCSPCSTCDPCSFGNEMILDGVVVGEYPLSSCQSRFSGSSMPGGYGPAYYGPAHYSPAHYGPAHYGPAHYSPAGYGSPAYGAGQPWPSQYSPDCGARMSPSMPMPPSYGPVSNGQPPCACQQHSGQNYSGLHSHSTPSAPTGSYGPPNYQYGPPSYPSGYQPSSPSYPQPQYSQPQPYYQQAPTSSPQYSPGSAPLQTQQPQIPQPQSPQPQTYYQGNQPQGQYGHYGQSQNAPGNGPAPAAQPRPVWSGQQNGSREYTEPQPVSPSNPTTASYNARRFQR